MGLWLLIQAFFLFGLLENGHVQFQFVARAIIGGYLLLGGQFVIGLLSVGVGGCRRCGAPFHRPKPHCPECGTPFDPAKLEKLSVAGDGENGGDAGDP